ncbi:MAG TPA: CRISPR-associated endonuclease Cas2 [Candidatus Hydrogenedentes bacterium]|mgnify:CR=1 FL=1|jgi:CRISPR-associated protein Cas2|nr:MAG: CRISPR-associated endoribonuclease Cas2 [Candidatus Hydrogenedentes bacterium ADurb.Bin170]HOD96303.1 CRISPR-associated endonuclease Cas2 [Candidatus Hydrogenedentota bacterium]HOR51302.1 CRISPR-associated endonuclease Cas2 [Candidatus Hydrogenedentota bacterium]HPK25731.1 CRISPR-associated endonuclease Cas2 [Candidatus Hydrogenedentota bacterium]HPX87409.1 CRISPR-associated endonuclease Cas2 [Candidatus Hydrogenedentota bacterium]
MKHWFLISYDVRDEKRLRKCAQTLEGYGQRIQFSIFRCYLSERTLQRLRWELSTILHLEDDLLVVRLCNSCVASIRANNEKTQWPDDPPGCIVI